MTRQFKRAVRLSKVPLRYFKCIGPVDGGWLVKTWCPFGGYGPVDRILMENGDIRRVGQ